MSLQNFTLFFIINNMYNVSQLEQMSYEKCLVPRRLNTTRKETDGKKADSSPADLNITPNKLYVIIFGIYTRCQ